MEQIIGRVFLFTIVLLLFFISCQKRSHSVKYLLEDVESFIDDSAMVFDSIVVVYSDDILINKFLKDDATPLIFNRKMEELYHYAYRYQNLLPSVDQLIRIDTLLMFSNKDTIYESLFSVPHIPVIRAFSDASCKFIIQDSDRKGERMTIKQSLIDTTYKEVYYYDKKFQIKKIVNTWKKNNCVYLPVCKLPQISTVQK